MHAVHVARVVADGGVDVRGVSAAGIPDSDSEVRIPVGVSPHNTVACHGFGILGGCSPGEQHSVLGRFNSQVSWLITGAGALCERRVRE